MEKFFVQSTTQTNGIEKQITVLGFRRRHTNRVKSKASDLLDTNEMVVKRENSKDWSYAFPVIHRPLINDNHD